MYAKVGVSTCVYVNVYLCGCVYMRECVNIYCERIYVCIYVYITMFMCQSVCMCVYVCMCLSMCM